MGIYFNYRHIYIYIYDVLDIQDKYCLNNYVISSFNSVS